MLLNQSDTFSNELLSPDGLCVLIQREYHPSINASCRKVEDFLLSSHFGRDLSIPSSELIHLVFMKLADEIRHFFLKESYFSRHPKKCETAQGKGPQGKATRNTLAKSGFGNHTPASTGDSKPASKVETFIG
jgi:hypothetical protein